MSGHTPWAEIKRAAQLLRRSRKPSAYVLLRYEDGGGQWIGPMDPFVAEVFVVHRQWDDRARRVVSARIVRNDQIGRDMGEPT